MNDWFAILDPRSLIIGLSVGVLLALLAAWVAWRRGIVLESRRLQPRLQELERLLDDTISEFNHRGEELARLDTRRQGLEEQITHADKRNARLEDKLELERRALSTAKQQLAALNTQVTEKEHYFQAQIKKLETAEQRLSESFERLAGKIFDDRSEKLSKLNQNQLDVLLKPLGEKLQEFRTTVTESHKQEIAQHQVLQEKLKQLEKLNQRLHGDAENLANALTGSVKTQGAWGEQQLEKLLELAGLVKGREYSTQVSITTDSGARVQPDLVLHLPEGKTIVMDAKVSLTAWSRYQGDGSSEEKAAALKQHIASIRNHIKSLGEKRYSEVEALNALDFVLMFVPIESALIEAMQTEPDLPAYALERKVALLSPTNFLATLRTVASVWSVHKQNKNAREIAKRAGLLYDKFVGFVDNLQQIGLKLDQARKSYHDAMGQLSSGAGNLVGQAEKLKNLGARNTKQLKAELTEGAEEADNPSLRVIATDKERPPEKK